jgi:hypothetical protein
MRACPRPSAAQGSLSFLCSSFCRCLRAHLGLSTLGRLPAMRP